MLTSWLWEWGKGVAKSFQPFLWCSVSVFTRERHANFDLSGVALKVVTCSLRALKWIKLLEILIWLR